MLWKLIMRSHENRNNFYNLYYDTEKNIITYENGDILSCDEYAEELNKDYKTKGMSVRIVMGKKCNFNCVYCSQHPFRKEIEKPWKYTPEELAEQIIKFTKPHGGLKNIQYWGGETLLYFNEIKRFQKYFTEHTTNEIRYGIVTNGSLLKGEIFKWILDNDIHITVSYDGPGQHLRGIDIFEDREIVENLKILKDRYKDRKLGLALSPVMSVYNPSHVEYIEYVKNKLGIDDFVLSEAVPIIVNDERMREFAIATEEFPKNSKDLYQQFIQSKIPQYAYMQYLIRDFLKNLGNPIPIDRSRCFLTDKDVLPVDTSGNIQVCQNICSDGIHESGDPYKYGNIFEDIEIPEPSITALRQRRTTRCKDCLVVSVCKGGCPYLTKEYLEYNCTSNFHHCTAAFAAAISIITKDTVAGYEPINVEN